MATIYLRHPVHGLKVESSEVLAQLDRDNGWVDYDPSVKPEPVVVPDPPAPVTIPDFLKAAPPAKTKASKKSEG